MDHDAARRRRRRDEEPLLSVPNGGSTSPVVAAKKKPSTRQRQKKRRRKSDNVDDETLSLGLVMRVGASLLVVFGVAYLFVQWMWPSSPTDEYADDGGYLVEQEEEAVLSTPAPTAPPKKATAPPLPVWELSDHAQFDAFGLALSLKQDDSTYSQFWNEARLLRKEFASRYGGENPARALLERGLSTFANNNTTTTFNGYPSDLIHTACRIKESIHRKSFHMAFGGYSVTAGRGNFFEQSFPLVLASILKRPFALLGIELQVRNAAIGGVPSFPYGWCMPNFWNSTPDVVSWDYSMNEAGGVTGGLEAYLRHVTMLQQNPKLIVKDTHMAKQRRHLLKKYVDEIIIFDPVVIHTDPAVDFFLDLPEDFRPEGFQEWRRFGAPPGAPGQAYHHPAVKEHEFIAWMLAMHFLSALELAAAKDVMLDCSSLKRGARTPILPPPQSSKNVTWSSLLYGQTIDDEKKKNQYRLNPIYCRTSFEPIVQGDLTSIVVSGTAGEDLDIMLPKGPMFYNKGWVMDLSDKEKLAKRKLQRFGGLGFVDSKKALYGIKASGPLQLLLPYETTSANTTTRMPREGDSALDWFVSIAVCEVNEKRDPGECKSEKDVTYVVGGIEAKEKHIMDSDGTLYLGKKLCMHIKVPEGAKISSRKAMREALATKGNDGSVMLQDDEKSEPDVTVGLPLEISVNNIHIHERKYACSVSHVVWEQTPMKSGSKR